MKTTAAIIHLLVLVFFAYVLVRKWKEVRGKLYWAALIYHMLAGAAVGLVYLYYYSANDTWHFFEDAKQLSEVARNNFGEYINLIFDFTNGKTISGQITGDFRSLIFVKLLSLFCLLSGDNYWICAGYFSLLSFGAAWFLYKEVTSHFSHSAPAAALAFLFFPSVIFWSSGVEKETLTLAALYFLSGMFLKIVFDEKIEKLQWILAVGSGVLLWGLKYYWAGVFFITVITAWIVLSISKKNDLIKKYSSQFYVFLFVIVGVAVSLLHPNFYLHRFLDVVVANHDAFVSLSADKSLIHYYQLKASVTSIIINSPWALFSGVFRPFISEGQTGLGLMASIENFVVLILFITSVISLRKHKLEAMDNILLIAVLSYCVVLCVFLALSTPNLGTLSRYRVGFLPFLVFIFSYRNSIYNSLTKNFLN